MTNLLTPLWADWIEFRKGQGWKAYKTDRSEKALQAFPIEAQDWAINNSMDKCYQGLFPENFKSATSDNSRGGKIKAGIQASVDKAAPLHAYVARQVFRLHVLSMSFAPDPAFTEATVQAFHDAMQKRGLTDSKEDIDRLRSAFDQYVMEERDWPKPSDILRRLPPRLVTAPQLEHFSPEKKLENIKRLGKLISGMKLGVQNGNN